MLYKKFKDSCSSLFMKLFTCFLIIIFILISFNIFTFKYYNDNLHDKIVNYDSLIFNSSVSRYNDYFTKLQAMLFDIGVDESVLKTAASREAWNYEMYRIVTLLMRNYDKLPYIEDIFIVMQDRDIVLSKDGSFSLDLFFNKYYKSGKYLSISQKSYTGSGIYEFKQGKYNMSYWCSLFNEPFVFKLLNTDMFKVTPYSGKLLLPVVYKPISLVGEKTAAKKYFICSLIDIEGLYKSINKISDPYFYISDNNSFIYSSDENMKPNLQILQPGTGLIRNNANYKLSSSSSRFNISYLKIYPLNEINSQVLRINILLIVMLIVVFFIAIAISLFFSYRFKNPITKIVEAIMSQNSNLVPAFSINTSISELKLLISRIKSMSEENKRIGNDLTNKNSLLQYYFCHNKIKNISSNLKNMGEFNLNYSNYAVILYKIVFKSEFHDKFDCQMENSLDFIKQLLDTVVSDHHPGSITFQIENEQFISIFNLTNRNKSEIMNTLNFINEIIANDKQYFTMILTCSEIYQDTSQLNVAYDEAFKIMKYRKLHNENQILTKEDVLVETNMIYFTMEQEKRIAEAMFNGDGQTLSILIDRVLDENYNKNVSTFYFNKLSIEIINNFIKTFNALKINVSNILKIEDMYEKLENFFTIDNYRELLHQSISDFTGFIKANKKDNDYIKDFAVNYIQNNYYKDIYLDMLAAKLKISPNYLSSYFKEKIGVNFIDYLNDVRIKNAKELLKGNTKKIHDIATETGYNSIHSFIRTFKRYTGVTPNEYRKDISISTHPERT